MTILSKDGFIILFSSHLFSWAMPFGRRRRPCLRERVGTSCPEVIYVTPPLNPLLGRGLVWPPHVPARRA